MRLFFVLFFLPFLVSAQLKQVSELNWFLPENLEEDINLIGLDGDFSLLINYNSTSFGRDKNVLLVKLNNDLAIEWESRVEVDKEALPVQYFVFRNIFYYLFKDSGSKAYILYNVNLDTGVAAFQKFKTLTDINSIQALFFNNYLLLRGIYDEKPIIEMHNLSDGTVKTLAGVFKKKQEIVEVLVNPYRNELYVFKTVGNNCGLEVSIYDNAARYISNFKLGDKEHKLNLGQVVFKEDGEAIVTGGFGKYCTGQSTGFFILSLDNVADIVYHSFENLESYSDVLSPKKNERREERRANGKSTQITERVMFTAPFQNNESIVLSGEMYAQQRVTNTNVFSSPSYLYSNRYGVYQPQLTENLFDYKINYLLLAEVGADFKLKNSYMKKIDAPKFRYLEPQSFIYGLGNKFFSFYSSENDLMYTFMNERGSSIEKYPLFTSEVYKFSNTDFKLLPLSDNNILVYGSTDVKDKFMITKEMYFIKKISLEDLR